MNGSDVCDMQNEIEVFWFDTAQNYFYEYDEFNRDYTIKPQFNQYKDLIMDLEAYMHLLRYYLNEVPSNDFIFKIAPKLQEKYEKVKKIMDGEVAQ